MIYNKTILWIIICSVLFLGGTISYSQELNPPSNVTAVDTPNDDGSSITITWDIPAEDSGVVGYKILRNTNGGELEEISEQLSPNETLTTKAELKFIRTEFKFNKYVDSAIDSSASHAYIVRAIAENGESVDSLQTRAIIAKPQWFHTGKIPLFIAMVIFCAAIVGNIYYAKGDKDIFVRRIPGLEAVDEAIGRATEMGRSILYTTGLGGVSDVATIASMTILGQVARRTADYETPLRVPCRDPIVMNVLREMVKSSYLDVGRPDIYNEDNIFFITDSQFAYAAGVDGMMLREKPAAIFLQGTFYAESLILAETGNSIGAIQIAGTDSEHQLPFFIAACDYTLIGEELYAASAYLSREPTLLGSLRGQDWGKVLIFATIVLGVVLELVDVNWITMLLQRVS